jgi:hypothetical protein
MAKQLLFKGLRYNPEKINDVSKLITPPYDIISEEERDGYYQFHPNNIIRLISGKDFPCDDQSTSIQNLPNFSIRGEIGNSDPGG